MREEHGGRAGQDSRIHANVSREGKEEVALREEEGGTNKGAKEGRMGDNHSTHTHRRHSGSH